MQPQANIQLESGTPPTTPVPSMPNPTTVPSIGAPANPGDIDPSSSAAPGASGSVAYPLQAQIAVTAAQQPIAAPNDDSDLIEKEWVDKAKQIVTSNISDPYKQSREMTILRADYMQKRYNKIIKLGE